MTGSAFEITLPEDWTVEVADPDPDLYSAAPGDAWEALRSSSPDRAMACSVSVGVASVSLRTRSGMASAPETVVPRWDESDPGTLVVPDARVDSAGRGELSTQMPIVRLHRGDPDLEHDVLYAVSCSASGDDRLAVLERTIEGIMETFGSLPHTP